MRTLFAGSALPRLTIAQRVIDKIVNNALIYQTETGESLVGFRIPSEGKPEPDLVVVETIPPDEDAVRENALFIQGDDLQGDIFNWYHDNWQRFQRGQKAGTKWDTTLVHLGDWHKHPGDLVEPSWGDADTARDIISDEKSGAPQLLVILATVWDQWMLEELGSVRRVRPHEVTELFGPLETVTTTRRVDEEAEYTLRIPIDNNSVVRIDFWYMSQQVRRFTRLKPNVVPNADLPDLVPLSWHLGAFERLQTEIEAMKQAGFAIIFNQWDTDQQAPLEICLALAKMESKDIVIMITSADYPNSRPKIRLTPISTVRDALDRPDLFKRCWDASQPLADSIDKKLKWTPNTLLAELAQQTEARLNEGQKKS